MASDSAVERPGGPSKEEEAGAGGVCTNSNDHPPPVRTRRKLGRRARQRKRKLLELEAAANVAIGKQEGHGAVPNGQTPETAANAGKDIGEISFASDVAPTTWTKNSDQPTTSGAGPSVKRVKAISKLTNEDRKHLTMQLGYLPGNALQVVARMKDVLRSGAKDTTVPITTTAANLEEPVVVKLYPLVLRRQSNGKKSKRKRQLQNGVGDQTLHPTTDQPPNDNNEPLLLEPFPTIFWVTHPRIKALVSKLELDGMGAKCEKILRAEERKEGMDGKEHSSLPTQQQYTTNDDHGAPAMDDALASMHKAHIAYGKERKDLLLPQDWEYIQQHKWESAFDIQTRGVAGILNHGSVKCLHAHVAHFWSGCGRDNVVGKWVAQQVERLLEESTMPSRC
ncbi:MAG: hypothetical protein SGARI_002564 [Bacillariaceae sp.]